MLGGASGGSAPSGVGAGCRRPPPHGPVAFALIVPAWLHVDVPAERLAERLGTTIASQGLREYYHPFTGAGMGATRFGWSSLVLELLEPPQAPGR